MSKQPRGHVRLSSGNTAGARVANVFDDIQKFQKRFTDFTSKNASNSKVTFNFQMSSNDSQFLTSIRDINRSISISR